MRRSTSPSRVRRGIDTQIAYRLHITSDVTLNTNLIYTHNLEINNFQDQLNPTFANRILGELGDPVDEFRLDMDVGYRNFMFGYRLHYIGPMYIGAWENNNGINGLPPANDDAFDIREVSVDHLQRHPVRVEHQQPGGFRQQPAVLLRCRQHLRPASAARHHRDRRRLCDLRHSWPQLLCRLPRPLLKRKRERPIRAGTDVPALFFGPTQVLGKRHGRGPSPTRARG